MNVDEPMLPPPSAEKTPQKPAALIDLHGIRARQAKLGKSIGKSGYIFLIAFGATCFGAAAASYIVDLPHIPGLVLMAAFIAIMIAVWWKRELSPLPATRDDGLTERLSADILAALPRHSELTPLVIWKAVQSHWQSRFLLNHLFVPSEILAQTLSADPADAAAVWETARAYADAADSDAITAGHLAGALMKSSPTFVELLKHAKLSAEDIDTVTAWLSRGIALVEQRPRSFSGIGRDWANGYTPGLDRFGYNITEGVMRSGGHYEWLAHSSHVTSMRTIMQQGPSAIALIGEPGVGKTSHAYALAELLATEADDRALENNYLISLSASMIISSATRPGELEYIMSSLLDETAHAGNVMLFFDDAELFFSSGVGAVDLSKLLLPVVQAKSIHLIFAFTPHSWQTLKSTNTSLASLMTPVALTEPPETDVMRVLEDTALGLEGKHRVLITYDALKEAYRLSGRYEQEVSYPGKAINLLEQAVTHAEDGIVRELAVQRAIEQSRGVKVAAATAAESDTLLNLENKIHERMINQTHAVGVVASALRRARAGVANPKRPIGSFLFLGPTGVGKTELAKAISAVYFGAEASMTRLDMSEYQQPDDVKRLLSDGKEETKSLIMSVRQQQFGVVLLDEIEKAHPNILNLLLQLLDEGQLTDTNGRMASFKDCIIICTSNAGADTIRERVGAGESLESFEDEFTDQLIKSGQFKPELLNRFDEMVLFRPLTPEELLQVVTLMMKEVNVTLAPQNISVALTDAAAGKIVEAGYDPRLGARPMRRTLQRAVEDVIAQKILKGDLHPGDHATLDTSDLAL